MTLLGRVLKLQALAWLVWSLAIGIAPRWLLETVFDQAPMPEYAWLRASAVMGIVLALLMVLVSRRLDDVWWWAWAFALLEVGLATVLIVNGAFALPPGSAAWPWWALGLVSLAFGIVDMVGLGLAGQEKPFV
jgi:hypothetical protein